MTWNLLGQYLTIVFASVLIARLVSLNAADYLALIAFSAFEAVEGFIYTALHSSPEPVQRILDYRVVFVAERFIAWFITIWLVYAVLTAILKQLPGILRFSRRYLNVTFGIAIIIALLTIRPEWTVARGGGDWGGRILILGYVLERAICFAELLAIFSILVFVLFFPFRVPRNLAVISTALCVVLSLQICLLLIRSYVPSFSQVILGRADEILFLGCVTYWVFALNRAGQAAPVTLGRGWHTVPHEHLVRQLEAMNAALLRSTEQT